jgi:hypothetical protein
MKRIALLLAGLTVIVLGMTACKHEEVSIPFRESFESGLGSWEKGADVPDDPNRPGQKVAWSIVTSTEQAAQGTHSAQFSLDGRQDDGTIWLMRAFRVPADKPYIVELSFLLWSESESFNTLAMAAAYAGAHRPEREADFDVEQAANQAAGWKAYTYRFTTRSDAAGTLWMAFGISVVWETEVAYYIDDVSVQIRPQL